MRLPSQDNGDLNILALEKIRIPLDGVVLNFAVILVALSVGARSLAATNSVQTPANPSVIDVKNYGARCDGKSDDTAAISAADAAAKGVVHFPTGQCIIAGSITRKPHRIWEGSGRTASADGGYAQFGTLLWCTGGGFACVTTTAMTANSGISLKGLAIAAAPSANYEWVVYTSGMANSDIDGTIIQSNEARCSGAAYFHNENPRATIGAYPPVWSNDIHSSTFGTTCGAAIRNETTDSRITDVYISGGIGSFEAGLNNEWTSFMIDDVDGSCLTVSPTAASTSGSYVVLANGNFQNCKKAALSFLPANGSFLPFPQHAVVSGVNFNNSSATDADVAIVDSSYLTFVGNHFSTRSARNFSSSGTIDHITALGNETPNGALALLKAGNVVASSSNGIAGGAYVSLSTRSGPGVEVRDISGVNCPLLIHGGIDAVLDGAIAIGCNAGLAVASPKYITLQANGASVLTASPTSVQSFEPIKLAEFKVSSLPKCNSPLSGEVVYVTDAELPTYNGPILGGANTKILALCNGLQWTAH